MRLFFCRFSSLAGLHLFGLICAAVVNIATASATTLVVTSTADSGAGSLRAALAATNDGDTIQFDPALNGQTISLTSGELVIGKSITINGPGSNLLTVARSSGTFRIFHVMPGRSVILGALTIYGGNSGNGGGILNDHATLTVDSCRVQFNFAPGGFGGGIFNYGIGSSGATLTILNSTLNNNATTYGGGAIANDVTTGGSLTITNSVVTGNSASQADVSGGSEGKGGGIYDIGGTATLTISNSIVSNNQAGPSAGAHYPGGYGGGIYHSSGTVIITNSTIAGNSAGFGGGGIYTRTGTQTIMTITSSTVSGNSVFGVFEGQPTFSSGGGIDINGTLTITNSTLSGNSAYSVGGGMSGGVLTIANSTLSGNTANNGGGISTGTLEIGNTILKTGTSGANISAGTVTSHGYNLSSDNGGGFLTGPGDQINTDPLLGPLQNNGGPTFTHDLLTGSPAIDAGDPSFTPPPLYDQRGLGYARVYNGRIDIGALEVQPAPSPTPTPTPTATATATATATVTPTATATAAASATPSPGECDVTEAFENITTLVPNGWVRRNNSQSAGTTEWFQGNANFAAQSGSPLSYIAADFLNGSGLATISNWLLTPPLTLKNGAKFSFWTRTKSSPIFPDRLQVRMSLNGTSSNVGTLPTDVGNFTTLLLDINPTYTTGGYPNAWTNFVVTISGLGVPMMGRLAFRYFVENGGPSGANSDYIGIDAVVYDCNGILPTPTPSTPTPTPSVTPTPGTPVSSIAGTILYCSSPLPNVRVNVTGTVTRSTLSDGSGNYQFTFLPWLGNFTVTPGKAALPPGTTGINTVDVIAVQRHFLGIGTPLSGCRLTAADVNGDTMINTVDVIAIQRFFLGLSTGIANVGKFQFTPASRSYTGNGTDYTAQNYDTVVLGDVAPPFAAP